jgi:hypothetical protein
MISGSCAGELRSAREALTSIFGSCAGSMSQLALTSVVGSCEGGLRIRARTTVVGSCAGQMQDAVVYANGYQYRRRIIVPPSNVFGGANITNFVMLVRETLTTLRSVANGGGVQHASGFDIRFELANGTKLDHRIERYVPTTGELIAWVRVPTLSATANTVLQMYYGNDAVVTTEENVAGVYQEYLAAWNARTGVDLTGQARTLTAENVGVGDVIGDAGDFNGTTSRLRAANFTAFNGLAAFTVQAIARPDAVPQNAFIVLSGPDGATSDTERGLVLAYEVAASGAGAANTISFKIHTSAGASRAEAPANSQPAANEIQYLAGVWQSGQAARLFVENAFVTPSNTPVVRTGTTLVERG